VSARSEFEEYRNDLLARMQSGGPAWTATEKGELRALHDVWVQDYARAARAFRTGMPVPMRPPPWDSVERRFGPVLDEPERVGRPTVATKRRYRRSLTFPISVFPELDRLFDEREISGSPSHQAIANSINRLLPKSGKFTKTRVQRLEKLRRLALENRGWDLSRLISHPDFWAGNGNCFCPTEHEARQVLGLRPSS
jgi:hypothetical protein